MSDSKAGRAWLDFVDEHGAMSVDDRPPIPPINIDDVAEAIREAGGLEEIPALYLLDLLAASEAARTQLGRSVLQERARAETSEAERSEIPVIPRAPAKGILGRIGGKRATDEEAAEHAAVVARLDAGAERSDVPTDQAIALAPRPAAEARTSDVLRQAISDVVGTPISPELAQKIMERVAELGPATGVDLIAAERRRQVEKEGWTPEHDDEHTSHEIAAAAAAYAIPVGPLRVGSPFPFIPFPDGWDLTWDKRPRFNGRALLATDLQPIDVRIRCLVKAGALVAAEVDRLDRLKKAGANVVGDIFPKKG